MLPFCSVHAFAGRLLHPPCISRPAGPRLLWSVKAARGALTSIVAVPSSSSSPAAGLNFGGGGGSALLATAGADGAVRIWRGADGRLLQSIESAHFTCAAACCCSLLLLPAAAAAPCCYSLLLLLSPSLSVAAATLQAGTAPHPNHLLLPPFAPAPAAPPEPAAGGLRTMAAWRQRRLQTPTQYLPLGWRHVRRG